MYICLSVFSRSTNFKRNYDDDSWAPCSARMPISQQQQLVLFLLAGMRFFFCLSALPQHRTDDETLENLPEGRRLTAKTPPSEPRVKVALCGNEITGLAVRDKVIKCREKFPGLKEDAREEKSGTGVDITARHLVGSVSCVWVWFSGDGWIGGKAAALALPRGAGLMRKDAVIK